jgi:hypothetical protein
MLKSYGQNDPKADKAKKSKKDIVKRLKKVVATLEKKYGSFKEASILDDIIREIETKL